MNSPFDHLVKHAMQPAAPSEPAPDKRPSRTFKLLELINQHPGISTEALSKQSGVCSQQIWTRLQRHLARGQVFHEAGGWRMSPDAPQLREVHQAIALLKKQGFSVQEPAEQAEPVAHTYASTQATNCAGCGEHKHTPLRIDAMGGYVCLTCIDNKLGSLLGEFGYPEPDDAQPAREPMAWPKARDVGRFGDMSPSAHLRVGLDGDNDAYVSVWDKDGGASVEFCNPGGGGGGASKRTREALIALMVAMEADNAERPDKDWWARRGINAQAKEG